MEPDNQYALNFAGDTYNTAVYMSRLLAPEYLIHYATVVGNDPISQKMLAAFSREGLDQALVFQHTTKSIGLYLIENDAKGERIFQYWRDDSAARTLMDSDRETQLAAALSNADLVYVSGISLAILPTQGRQKLIDLLKQSNTPIAFDPNHRPRLWNSLEEARENYERISAISTYILASHEDNQAIWDVMHPQDGLKLWRATSDAEVVIKNGSLTTLAENNIENTEVTPDPVDRPIDTTGAGDAFNAAYLAARLQGKDLALSIGEAHCLARRVIMNHGAILATHN